jgi:glutamate-ammonia-ligase adenylyltransferase
VRNAVISTPRDVDKLSAEIVDMRAKVRSAHPAKGHHFDVKHSMGGMVDIEFAVQFLVLSQCAAHPELLANVGNIALLHRSQMCGLLPGSVGDDAAQAYRTLRQIQHKARLNEEPTQVDEAAAEWQRAAGLALWACVFSAAHQH